MKTPSPVVDSLAMRHMADDATLQALADIAVASESVNTTRAYQSALKYWTLWHELRIGQTMRLPLTLDAVLMLIADHAKREPKLGHALYGLPKDIEAQLIARGVKDKTGPMTLSTLQHRISVISKARQWLGVANPCATETVKQLMTQVRRAYAKRGDLPQKKPAIVRSPLDRLLDTCDDSLRGTRDRALLLFAWASGGRRRSEVAQARIEHLTRLGDGQYVYHLAVSKTNQSGLQRPENFKPLAGKAADALDLWLQRAGLFEGPIFRTIYKNDIMGTKPMSDASINQMVKTRAALAGLDPRFSAHSLRAGFVTEAGRQNIPIQEGMAMTGHHSVTIFMGYYRAGNLLNGQAAKLLDEPS